VPRLVVLLAAAALAVAGCGQAEDAEVDQFSGAERGVAQAVEDMQQAGQRRDAERMCSEILARELVAQLDEGPQTCGGEMDKALDDADDFDLKVLDVTVTGDEARATVERGNENERSTFTFARERGRWRATGFGL
jgi:hypothetical protein